MTKFGDSGFSTVTGMEQKITWACLIFSSTERYLASRYVAIINWYQSYLGVSRVSVKDHVTRPFRKMPTLSKILESLRINSMVCASKWQQLNTIRRPLIEFAFQIQARPFSLTNRKNMKTSTLKPPKLSFSFLFSNCRKPRVVRFIYFTP